VSCFSGLFGAWCQKGGDVWGEPKLFVLFGYLLCFLCSKHLASGWFVIIRHELYVV
jgi:hypothetical protein